MEKKGNRNLPASRGSVTDSKKNQDGVVSKLWPRGSRRREPSVSNLPTKSETTRRPQPQRNKTIDKRPKPRGFYYTTAGSRNEATRLGEEEAELGSLFLPGSKKQSLNHLLNFSYAPRDNYQPERGPGKSDGRLLVTKKHKYNKEHFLQANCQFVVKDSGDYRQYMSNPDALVDWNLIEQVNIQVSEFPSCPICLYPPVAAKMTRCGHIYCWSCILHYLSLSDKLWRKCPICYESVAKSDLKSVIAIPHSTFNVNETITFKLMKRPRGCLIAYPVDSIIKNDILFNMSEKDANEVYSKLLLANKVNILSIIDRESRELTAQMAEDENCPEKCFIEQAVSLLDERKSSISNNASVRAASTLMEKHLLKQPFSELDLVANEDHVDISKGSANQLPKFHYFYQASDGQHIYLHAINARMLEHTYGSLEFGPKTITGKILQKEGGSMTEDLRKRLRYLQHLPLTCQFEVAEIQLNQPVITKETLDHFQDQIESRKKKRQRRAKEEKRREKRIEAEENRKMGKYPVQNLHLESHLQFPEFGFEQRIRSESENTQHSESNSLCLENVSDGTSSPFAGSLLENACAGPSFADMLTCEKKVPVWPSAKPKLSITPVKMVNVTGTKTIATKTCFESDHEPEDYEPVPDFNRSFGDSLAQVLQKMENIDVNDSPALGKKKKKNKQKVLFTTHMAYNGN